MPDREKVIKGLESCMKWTGEPNTATCHCSDCSYTNMDIFGQRCLIDLINDALTLLKEQEAVEPYIAGSGESFETAETWWYECGNCNKPIDPNDKFCRHCGRSVKWG